MIYFDTSYLAKCYLTEPGSAAVRALAAAQDAIACSAFGRVELVAAFHRKLREGEVDRQQFSVLLDQLDLDDSAGLWTWLPVTAELLRATAARIRALPTDRYVRSADALHLTCAAAGGFATIFSNDRHLLAAAPHFHVRGENVIGT